MPLYIINICIYSRLAYSLSYKPSLSRRAISTNLWHHSQHGRKTRVSADAAGGLDGATWSTLRCVTII